MFSARFLTVFALAAGFGFVVANCGSSDDAGSSSNNLNCPSNTGGGTCTAEQNKAYSDCIIGKCDAKYQACLGAGYKSGSYSGPCGTWIGCTAKCGCGDMMCRSACGLPDQACQTCFSGELAQCVLASGCTAPVCTGGGTGGSGGGTGGSGGGTGGSGGGTGGSGGGGGGTCADLMKCCNAMTNADSKASCNQAYMGVMAGGDQACGGVLAIYRANKLCP
jgi:hypothetical protein